MGAKKKTVDDYRKDHEDAVALYKDKGSPFLYEKAQAAKARLDAAIKAELKQPKRPEPITLFNI